MEEKEGVRTTTRKSASHGATERAGTDAKRPVRYVVLGVSRGPLDQDAEASEYYEELRRLVESAGGCVVAQHVQTRQKPDPRTYVGSGFAKEISERILAAREAAESEATDGEGPAFEDSASQEDGEEPERQNQGKRPEGDPDGIEADYVLLAEEVPPRTLAALSDLFPLPVLDRTGLILGIFADRARSAEGRLEVELAECLYRLPRLRGSYTSLGRQRGGVGLRAGAGETALELDRRRIRHRIADLKAELERLSTERTRRRESRAGLPRVSLVGYTNAGKTTLLRALAGNTQPGAPRLFDTLDPMTRRTWVPGIGEVLLTDTVGFVRDLPAGLLDAFSATLEEVTETDLLLHVVNGAQLEAPGQYRAVRALLDRLGAGDLPELAVFTHRSQGRVGEALLGDRGTVGESVCVDALTGEGLDDLREALSHALVTDREEVFITLRPEQWKWVEFAKRHGEAAVDPREDGTIRVRARLNHRDAAILRSGAREPERV